MGSRNFTITAAAVILGALMCASLQAQEGPLDKAQPSGITTDEILKRMANQETTLRKRARVMHTGRR